MHDIPLRDLYSRSYFRDVGRAWERLLSACPIDGIAVRDVVVESWRRCVARGVDPRRGTAPTDLAVDGLERLYRANDALHDAIGESVAPIVGHLAGTRMVLVTSDAEGTLLSADADPSLTGQMIANGISPGACWAEGRGGTNAVGTALALGRATQIHAQEHFCEAGKPWSCNAALIRDPVDGTVLGVVDVTGPNDQLVMHATPFVATLVGRIEAHLRARVLAERSRLIDAFEAAARSGEAVVLCDAQGRIVKVTEEAGALLRRRCGTVDRIVGLSGAALVREDFRAMPRWLRPEFLSPLWDGGRCAGALLRLPRAAPRSAAATLSPPFRAMADGSPSLLPLLREAERFAQSDVPVLLEGETGTGKDLLAQAIHAAGPHSAGPFLPVNCAALPREILASELFGHAEGAFTGARRGGAKGRFEQADGGTLFLDEIGDMPLDLQPYLLRVLEEKMVWRLGEGCARPVAVRIIAATNRPLAQEVGRGFRADLYYRLNLASVTLPPLRERLGDLGSLVEHLLRESGRRWPIEPAVMRAFMGYGWPGNVRELRNVMERLMLLATDEVLRAAHLPPALREGAADAPCATLRGAERRMILATLDREGGNCSAAARSLGISRATLYRRLSAYGIEVHLHADTRITPQLPSPAGLTRGSR